MCQPVGKDDKFVAMVSAEASVDLRLSDYKPRRELRSELHTLKAPRFAAIDAHNHLDSQSPDEVLRILDEVGVERIINITMQTGDAALAQIHRYRQASSTQFASIGWMDWQGLERSDFVERTIERLERLMEAGICGIKFWKDFGLSLRDAQGRLLRIDDEHFAPIFEKAGEWKLPVMFHTADPAAFFRPIDEKNERYEELAAHPDWAFSDLPVTRDDLFEQRNRVFARHPQTSFIGAHLAESGEDLAAVRRWLEQYPNLSVDISARTPELGRQPYSARRFFLDFADRIVFGTDLLPEIEMYRLHYRFLETADEYFDYPSHASRQGRWSIYGLYLPDNVLEKVYRTNALRLFGHLW